MRVPDSRGVRLAPLLFLLLVVAATELRAGGDAAEVDVDQLAHHEEELREVHGPVVVLVDLLEELQVAVVHYALVEVDADGLEQLLALGRVELPALVVVELD